MIRGVAIPGLGMAAGELPDVPGLLRLDNPEIGAGARLDLPSYTLRDVAEGHARRIAAVADATEPFWVLGMSMGGMITSLLATEFRALLPKSTRFVFLVTSANTAAVPAISDARLAEWTRARPGSVESFREVMGPFFSRSFTAASADKTEAYFQYRAAGANGQSPRAFMRQVTALRAFDGATSFARVDPGEALVIGGADDYVLGPAHSAEIKRLLPGARHVELKDVGHMINIERPDVFQSFDRLGGLA